jgi:hypothetical protein
MARFLVIAALLAILWAHSVATDRWLGRRIGGRQTGFLILLLPMQVAVAALTAYTADWIGLRNPAGLVLSSTVLASAGGVLLVVLRYNTTEQNE